MKTIWKWELEPHTKISMPKDAKILCVQMQGRNPQLWALVDPLVKEKEIRQFNTYGTGNNIPDQPGEYIGTFQMESGSLVFHVFETKL